MGQKEKSSRPSSEELVPQPSNMGELTKDVESEEQEDEVNYQKPLNTTGPVIEQDHSDDVDSLVMGVKECHLDHKFKDDVVDGTVDGTAQDLSERLTQLDLDGGDIKKETKEVILTRRQGPEEDDESEVPTPKHEQESEEPSAARDNDDQEEEEKVKMVKLEAPKEDEKTQEEESDALIARSPAGGIPVYPNQNRNQNFDVFVGGCLPGSQNATWNRMPDNFNAQVQLKPNYDPGIKGKRGRNDLDNCADATKFFRPQMVPTECRLNNLDAPGQPTSVRSINQVCVRQMSGGTVFTDPNANDSKQPGECLDSQELQDAVNFLTSAGFDIDNLLPQDGSDITCLPQTSTAAATFKCNRQQHQNRCLQQQQPCPSQNIDPSAQNSIYLQQQQQQIRGQSDVVGPIHDRFQQEKDTVGRFVSHPGLTSPLQKMAQSSDDCGYNSPSHEFVMEGSPAATMGSSPPEQNLSPPPSNMSVLSFDSGICSPMGEEGTSSQMKSPRSVQMMSPESISLSVIQDNAYLFDTVTALPQQDNLGANPLAMSPPQCSAPSLKTSLQMATVAAPQQYTRAPVQQLATASAPQPCQRSQLSPTVSNEDVDNYSCPFISENLLALNDALDIARKDLEQDQKHPFNPRDNVCQQQAAPPNIPSTVPQDITSLSVQGQNSNGPPGVLGKQLAPSTIKKSDSPPKKTTAKAVPVKRTAARKDIDTFRVVDRFVPNSPVTVSGPSGNLVITTCPSVGTTTPPSFNSNGKIAIPPTRPKHRPVTGTAVPLCLFTPNGLQPLIVLPKEQKPRYAPIAPKAPSKPPKPAESRPANVPATSQSSQGQEKQANRSPSMKDKLNVARRSVAAVERGDLLFRDHDGDTYVHVAVCQADENLIEAFLERLDREHLRDMVNAQNMMGQTPLYLAVCENKPEMVEVLVRYGADVKHFAEATLDNGTHEKSTAIHRASSKGEGYLKTLKALLQSPDIDVNQMDSEGHTALHCAILNHGKMDTDNKVINSIPIIEALIPAGADPNLKVQKDGKTALMFALESRNFDIMESLFGLVEPAKLPGYLKTESFDGITCIKIVTSMRSSMTVANQQRLTKCLKPGSHRADH